MDEDRYTRITLRIPKDLHAKLQEHADATSKSTNAEIVSRLESTFADRKADTEEVGDESDQLRNELISIIERKRKNDETLLQLVTEGFKVQDMELAFSREWRLMAPRARQIAQRLGELGKAESVREITRIPKKK